MAGQEGRFELAIKSLALFLLFAGIFIAAWVSFAAPFPDAISNNDVDDPAAMARSAKLERRFFLFLGTASPGGAYHYVGSLLADFLATDALEKPLKAIATGGSYDNLDRLLQGELDLAMLEHRVLCERAAISPEPRDKLRLLGRLWSEQVQLVLRPIAWEKGLPDLKTLLGARVGVGLEKSGTADLYQKFCAALGVEKPGAVHLGFDEAAAALARGRLDVCFFTGAAPLPVVETLLASEGFALYPLAGPDRDLLCRSLPFLRPATLTGGHYFGLTGEIPTLCHDNTLVCGADLSDETIQALLEELGRYHIPLATRTPIWNEVDWRPREGEAIPSHPGVLVWWRDRQALIAQPLETGGIASPTEAAGG